MKDVFDSELQKDDHEMCQIAGRWHIDDGFCWSKFEVVIDVNQ